MSACLLGMPCRHDGRGRSTQKVLAAVEGLEVIPICPEAGGGMGVPRAPVQLSGGDGDAVLDGQARVVGAADAQDRTVAMLAGARLAVEAALRHGVARAILKEQSPSCGAHRVWIDGAVARGRGVTAAALARAAIPVLSDEDL